MLITIPTPTTLKVNGLEDLPKLREFMDENNLKVNKSEIARQLNVDRKTVNKYLNGFEKSQHRKKQSKCDEFKEIISELLESDTQIFYYRSVLYRYMTDNYEFNIPEQTFYHYLKSVPEFDNYFKKGKMSNSKALPVIRFETAPGIQAQLDWKDKVKFVLKNGEEITVYVMSLVMGHSRFRIYKPSIYTTQEVLLHLLTETFESLGGVPHVILTDNMKTVMESPRTLSSAGDINEKFEAFAKDYGFTLKACVAANPQTKGKVESQMKYLAEIEAYSGKLDLVELYELVARINYRVNCMISQGTGKIPINELKKDKDSLLPLPNESIRNQYRIKTKKVTVNPASMINVRTCQYSVPSEYVGKTVEYQIHDSNIYVYYNTKLIAVHKISNLKLNYTPDHYCEILSLKFPGKTSDEISKMAKENLKIIGGIYSNE